MAAIPTSGNSDSNSFQKIADAFLSQPGLPFAEILSPKRIERVFAKHENLFGCGAIYSTAVMVWSFLGQVLCDGKARWQGGFLPSGRVVGRRVLLAAGDVAYCLQREVTIPTADTGDYCGARAKLSEAALRGLMREVAAEVEEQAVSTWLWLGLHAKLVDGFTFTMPDTEENQAEYPQAKTQKPGIGFPIARAVAILSLATACVMDVAVGPGTDRRLVGRKGDRGNCLVTSVA